MQGFEKLEHDIIKKGLCTVCGTCAGVCPEGIVKFKDLNGELLPYNRGNCSRCNVCYKSCPGAGVDLLKMETELFGRQRTSGQPDYGVHGTLGYGCAVNLNIRQKGSSGGVVTALLTHALDEKLIDAAIVAGFNPGQPWRTSTVIAATSDEILQASQSKYAVVPVNDCLLQAANQYERLAVVGLPCHIHALRKIQINKKPKRVAESLKYMIGLNCAAQFYFEGTRHVLQEWGDVEDVENLSSLEYRGGGWPGHMVAKNKEGKTTTIDRHQYMYHMLAPAYKRDRCEMCIDWSAELSDISCGDYWPLNSDGLGGYTSIIVRSDSGEALLEKCIEDNILNVQRLHGEEANTIAGSMGYELKKHAAAYRLQQRKYFGWPVPDYGNISDWSPFRRSFHYAPEKKK